MQISRIFSYMLWGFSATGWLGVSLVLALGTAISGERLLFGIVGFLAFFLSGGGFLFTVYTECKVLKMDISTEDKNALLNLHPLTSGAVAEYPYNVWRISNKYRNKGDLAFFYKIIPYSVLLSIPLFVAMGIIAYYQIGY
ncbi:hypothetical protein [Shewanella sp. SR44-3]|uniref:hypothetical protein n=1 Tax=Shewanella sp. SR44-3 TaxID=2760936 RepID=UPI0015FE04C1|nr:hypothetical protein [Shewanella sp. SR44-3]MBB1271187.1 hypothetical protein [Shewanella sp. SR44-3]